MKEAVDRLQNKLKRLVVKHEDVKSVNQQLKEKLLSLQQKLENEQKNVSELKDKNKILKLSASLQGEEQDAKAARERINELLREIDKCIALLNK